MHSMLVQALQPCRLSKMHNQDLSLPPVTASKHLMAFYVSSTLLQTPPCPARPTRPASPSPVVPTLHQSCSATASQQPLNHPLLPIPTVYRCSPQCHPAALPADWYYSSAWARPGRRFVHSCCRHSLLSGRGCNEWVCSAGSIEKSYMILELAWLRRRLYSAAKWGRSWCVDQL